MQNMSRSGLIEEQGLPQYSQKRYYPVRIGQQLNARYKVIAKLGFGAYSTVWLVRDQKYVASKPRGSDRTQLTLKQDKQI